LPSTFEGLILRTAKNIFPGLEVLVCPVCGFECMHPLKVKVATGHSMTTVDSKGTHRSKGESPETRKALSERGTRIILEYCCENNHHGNIILQFHKGNLFVEDEVLPKLEKWETLWRT